MQEYTVICPNCKSAVPIGYPICPYCGFDLRPIIRFKAKQELTKYDILMRVKKALIRPWEIHKEIALAEDSLGPFIIALLLAFIFAIRLLITSSNIGLLAGLAIKDLGIFFFMSFFVSMALMLLIWLVLSIVANLIFKLLGAKTNFPLTRCMVGYSLAIVIPFLLVNTIILALSTSELDIINNAMIARMIMFSGMILFVAFLSEGASKTYFINRILVFIIFLPIISTPYFV